MAKSFKFNTSKLLATSALVVALGATSAHANAHSVGSWEIGLTGGYSFAEGDSSYYDYAGSNQTALGTIPENNGYPVDTRYFTDSNLDLDNSYDVDAYIRHQLNSKVDLGVGIKWTEFEDSEFKSNSQVGGISFFRTYASSSLESLVVDIDAGYRLESNKSRGRVFVGLRYENIESSFNNTNIADYSSVVGLTRAAIVSSDDDNDRFGVHFGIEGETNSRFHLGGLLDLGITYGKNKSQGRVIRTQSGSGAYNIRTEASDDRHEFSYRLEGKAYGGYNINKNATINIGYQVELVSGALSNIDEILAVESRGLFDSAGTSLSPIEYSADPDDVVTHGPFIQLKWRFQ